MKDTYKQHNNAFENLGQCQSQPRQATERLVLDGGVYGFEFAVRVKTVCESELIQTFGEFFGFHGWWRFGSRTVRRRY